jgi:cyclic beta-1,2-glucan synthetase
MLNKNVELYRFPDVYRQAIDDTYRLIEIIQETDPENYTNGLNWLSELRETLIKAVGTTEILVNRFDVMIQKINSFAEAMKFLPLYDKKKQLFTIGYNVDENKLTNRRISLSRLCNRGKWEAC